MTGAVVSRTVTVKLRVAVLPAASCALQLTVAVPIANSDPEEREHCTATLPLVSSTADTVQLTTAPLGEVASATMFAGTVMTGGVVSDPP
jgi:hypothetical protein